MKYKRHKSRYKLEKKCINRVSMEQVVLPYLFSESDVTTFNNIIESLEENKKITVSVCKNFYTFYYKNSKVTHKNIWVNNSDEDNDSITEFYNKNIIIVPYKVDIDFIKYA